MRLHLTLLATLLALGGLLLGSGAPATAGEPAAKIQWFGTWAAARAEAKRTGRPILLTSAAPQCKGTSGIW